MNHVALIGRLTRDVEVRQAGNTSVARFTLAVDRRFKKDGEQTADFISCVAFGKTAEFIEKHISKKGQKMVVEGRIQTGSYKDKDDKTVYTTDVIIDQVEFGEGKGETSAESGATKADKKQKQDSDGFMNIPDGVDAELPFN